MPPLHVQRQAAQRVLHRGLHGHDTRPRDLHQGGPVPRTGIQIVRRVFKLILGVERDWTAYRSDSGDKRTCFVSSEPKSSKGDYKKENRGDVRVYVTHGPAQDVTNEVSIKAGYDHKEQSIVKYTIDGKKFSLFTLKDRAWAETPQLDSKIVSAMKAGNKLIVSGTSSRGTDTEDIYSLFGFTAALKLIDKACGR